MLVSLWTVNFGADSFRIFVVLVPFFVCAYLFCFCVYQYLFKVNC